VTSQSHGEVVTPFNGQNVDKGLKWADRMLLIAVALFSLCCTVNGLNNMSNTQTPLTTFEPPSWSRKWLTLSNEKATGKHMKRNQGKRRRKGQGQAFFVTPIW